MLRLLDSQDPTRFAIDQRGSLAAKEANCSTIVYACVAGFSDLECLSRCLCCEVLPHAVENFFEVAGAASSKH